MTKPVQRLLICGAVAVAIAGGPLSSPLSASNPAPPVAAALCSAPDVASAGVTAPQDRCARERRNERRMCRRYGVLSWQCLNAYIRTAMCEGRYVDSHAVATSMGAVRGVSLRPLLNEGSP